MRRYFSLLLVVVFVSVLPLSVFAGGQSEQTDSDQTNLVVMGGAHLVSIAEVVLEDYLAANPDISIEYQKFPFAEYPTKMRLQLSAGESEPDIMIIHDFLAPQFAETGWLLDVADRIPEGQLLDTLDAATIGEQVFGVPNQSQVQVFVYRQDAFDELGLEAPATIDDYMEAASALRDSDHYIGAYDPNEDAVYLYLIYLHMFGGGIFDYDGNVALDSPEAADALRMLKSAVDAGLYHESNRFTDEYWTAVNSGEIVGLIDGSFATAYFDSNIDPQGAGGFGEWHMSMPPRFSDSGPTTYTKNTEFWVINNLSDAPEAAWDVVEYLTLSEEAGRTFAEIDREGLMVRMTNNYLPSLENIEEDSPGWEMFGGQQILSEISGILLTQNPRIPYVDARSSEAERILDRELSLFFEGNGKTPEQVLADAAAAIREID
jgi:multiple sugar transport system substrate-binding protein